MTDSDAALKKYEKKVTASLGKNCPGCDVPPHAYHALDCPLVICGSEKIVWGSEGLAPDIPEKQVCRGHLAEAALLLLDRYQAGGDVGDLNDVRDLIRIMAHE